HPRELAIAHPADVAYAVLGAKIQLDPPARDPHVAVAQGGQSEGVVLRGVLRVAHPRERVFHQAHDGGEDLLPRQVRQTEIGGDAAADRRQRLAELEHVLVFRFIPGVSPARVVAILFAPPRVPSRGLEMPILEGADPYVGPCWRNGQSPDAGQLRGIPDYLPLRASIGEASSTPVTGDPRLPIADVPQPCDPGRGDVFG